MSLSGEVLAIGGLPEKCLGALEAGVERVFIPEDNGRQVKDLPKEVRGGLKISSFTHIDPLIREVFKNV